ncbi:MAG: proline iminopeptidase-family hydrolase [Gemmatimonadota bacterium]|nr:proline iminopeptidase-family hydrolase [Gemmatimonadota bacterium]
MRLLKRLAIGLSTLVFSACATPQAPPTDEGFITGPGGRVYWARTGAGPGTPLLVIHGGPGSGSWGLKPWAELGDERLVVRYDQLGAGKSDHPTDTTLYTVARYVQELQAIRDSLGLTEVHLYGRSWGAMLVEAYMGTAPAGVRSVTLSSPLVTTAQWEADADSLILLLPDSMQQAIARHQAAGTTDHAEYQAAMTEYYARHLGRQPRRSPADADSARQTSGSFVYGYMWGPSEFTATGTLKTFDATEWLRGIRVPALFVTGEFDEATPASTEMFSKLVPGSEFAVVPNAGHSTENDNPEALLRIVRNFLRRVEAGRR